MKKAVFLDHSVDKKGIPKRYSMLTNLAVVWDSGLSRSSLDLSCADELSKSKTVAVHRLIVYYTP